LDDLPAQDHGGVFHMIVLEKEAFKKRCPENDAGTTCVGSVCMAWRHYGWKMPGGKVNTLRDRQSPEWLSMGYCGKAGRPL
jgi:hypothetical protein